MFVLMRKYLDNMPMLKNNSKGNYFKTELDRQTAIIINNYDKYKKHKTSLAI